MNLTKITDRIGDWNPQLLREFSGKITRTSTTFILISSALVQALGCLWLFGGNVSEQRLLTGFHFLNWSIPLLTILGGIYSLLADFNREQKTGTLNFVKLSPQPGRTILLGKIIGAPCLLYLAIISLVPLHLSLGILNGANLGVLIAWYLTIGVLAYLCLSLTALYALYCGGKHAILVALLAAQPLSSALSLCNYYLISTLDLSSIDRHLPAFRWFGLVAFDNIWQSYLFVCCTLLAICHWLWIVIDRKYVNLQATSLQKQQSYWVNIQFQLWLLGFALPLINSSSRDEKFYLLIRFHTSGAIFTAILLATILPSSKSLQNWSRDWQKRSGTRSQFSWRNPEFVRASIGQDGAPVILATICNLLVTAAIWELVAIGLFIFTSNVELFGRFSIGIALGCSLVLLYTLLVHLINLQPRLKRNVAVVPLFVMSLVPCFCAAFVLVILPNNESLGKELAGMFLLYSPSFSVAIFVMSLSLPTIVIAALGQLLAIVKLNQIFNRKLITIGSDQMMARASPKFSLPRENTKTRS